MQTQLSVRRTCPMNNSVKLTDLGVALQNSIRGIEQFDVKQDTTKEKVTFHVTHMGQALSSAYEQLRNASEYAEDHLLLQRAARRFFVRNINFHTKQLPPKLAEELTIELTQSEYLPNDSVAMAEINSLNQTIQDLYASYWNIINDDKTISKDIARKWTLDLLAVRAEHVYSPPIRIMNFAHFAHAYYSKQIDVQQYIVADEKVSPDIYQLMIYIAVHRALLKSDDANIRSLLLDLYQIKPGDTQQFTRFNVQSDTLFELKTVDRLTRVISKNGAHLRIMKAAFFDKGSTIASELLPKQENVLSAVSQHVDEAYKATKSKLNSGIIKSILFLLITKAIVGVAIEVPYDLAVTGTIIVVPLLINLLFPAVFIALTTLTLKLPSVSNTKVIVDSIDEIIYDDPQRTASYFKFKTFSQTKQPVAFNIVYAIMFIIGIGIIVNQLAALDFNIIQGVIFVFFLSTAAFLGYRLSLQIKELELISGGQNIFGLLRDFFYTPFIFIGHQISFRYSKINLVARILDTVIELPLKTTLRLIRQWTTFLSNKKEELL